MLKLPRLARSEATRNPKAHDQPDKGRPTRPEAPLEHCGRSTRQVPQIAISSKDIQNQLSTIMDQ